MKTLKILAVSVLMMPVLVFGQVATTSTTTPEIVLPAAGLTPSSPLYFLNRVSEALQEFFTFNPEAKARLELQFAAERIAEIQKMLVDSGATAPGIDVAKARLADNLAKATAAVDSIKNSGKDTSALAKEVSDKITSEKLALKKVFNREDGSLSEQQKSLQEKISEANKAGDSAKAQELEKDLSSVGSERDALKKHEDESSQNFDSEDEKADSSLSLKEQAQSAIDDAKKSRAELLVEMPQLTAADLVLADKAISSAEDLFAKENYQAAKELAHQAESALERAKESSEKEAEKESESAKTEGEQLNEEQKSASEQIIEEQKKAAEQMYEEQKRALELNQELNKSGSTSQEVED